MVEQRRNIFISHIHEDDHRLEPLKTLLSKSGMEVKDGSINSEKPNNANNPEYIKYQILAPRIQWASVLVVLITPDTKLSDYVQWEIEYAASLGKRIVGVWDHGEAECDMPEALDRYANAVVGWQGERVKDAIEGTVNNRERPDGSIAPPRDTIRYSC
ncbi:TIR domain-containing protein [Cupriavidus basilensis]|uniref:TIR domain-containing protein n=1 Tax=Cupriavidus basilensis TaxID=68895 RepID=UPI0023E806D5|nr:TIR domain-containing protein [Cupriavidus basilensis]MDF3883640.1 TIR domain-containing protein [Cupriavidus basilensis]